MKVVVAGSCQSVSLAGSLSVMLPGTRVERFPTGVAFESSAERGDVVFRQRNRLTAWTRDALGPNEFLYPRVWFNAFQPDLTYVRGPSGPLPAPMGEYHSSLVLYAWARGLSAAQTAELFCEAVFERLGFFDCWDAAERALVEEGRITGLPIETMFARWERLGAFMHTANHPVLGVTAELARELLRVAGIAPLLQTPEWYLNDPLLEKAVWPVYPEIAARLGVPGSYAFKPPHPLGAAPAIFELEELIARSFAAYARTAPDALQCTRLENPAYLELESVRAGERRRPRPHDEWAEFEVFHSFEQPHQLIGDWAQPALPSMDALPPASMRASLEAVLPAAMSARTVVTVACTVRNEGDVALASGGTYPVFLCYRWYDDRGDQVEAGSSVHTPLPAALAPGARVLVEMRLAAPQFAGAYRLRVALLQSQVAWFDDVDPRNALESAVTVTAKTPALARGGAAATGA